jgi:hypothetical protein
VLKTFEDFKAVYRRKTDNTMAIRQKTYEQQWSIKKTTNNLKIEQHVPNYKPEVNTSAPDRQHNGYKGKDIRTNNGL